MIKIITVCGLGVGSSLILKMTVDQIAREIGLNCTIEHWDMGTIAGVPHDLIISSKDLKGSFPTNITKIIYVDNIIDVHEIKSKLEAFLREKGGEN